MAEPLFINELIQKVHAGQIRIPSFQRGFVWDADRVADLMDSIYKVFTFGQFLVFFRLFLGLAKGKTILFLKFIMTWVGNLLHKIQTLFMSQMIRQKSRHTFP